MTAMYLLKCEESGHDAENWTLEFIKTWFLLVLVYTVHVEEEELTYGKPAIGRK